MNALGARTLEAWMPKRREVSNKYQIFRVEDEKEEAIGTIKAEEESGVVKVDGRQRGGKKRVAKDQERSAKKKDE